MAVQNPAGSRRRASGLALGAFLGLLYLFLYLPIAYVIFASLQANPASPFPPEFTTANFAGLAERPDFQAGLRNSLLLGAGTGALAAVLATAGAIGLLRYRVAGRKYVIALFVAPLFVADLLIGISSLLFYRSFIGLAGSLWTTVLANTTYAFAFAFLIVLAQLLRYDWRMDEAATVFGASPLRAFREVTLPIIWPGIFGAFLVTFILAFNNLNITFYNVGAIPTLPTIAWGSLRYGLRPELYAQAAVINLAVFGVVALVYGLLRAGLLQLGPPDE